MSNNFHIYTNSPSFPFSEHESYLEEGFCGICTNGTAIIEIFSTLNKVSKNDLINILPMQLVTIREKSDDFSITYFKVERVMFIDTMCCMGKITPDFFFFMRKNNCYHLNDKETERFLNFCHVVKFRNSSGDPHFRRETIIHLLRIYYWDFYTYFQKERSQLINPLNRSRKETIASQFAFLVAEHFKEHREITFYANRLCISPIYLTKVIQEMFGESPHKVIADHIVIEIKTSLRNPSVNIKQIVQQIGFANQSSMSRFFRKHTGMSPSQYRLSVHI